MIQHNFNKDDNIFYIDYIGKIVKKDVIELYDYLLSEKNLPDHLLIFQDEKEADFIDSESLIPIAVESFKKLSVIHSSVKIAIWQTEPTMTAYSFVFKKTFDLKNFMIEVFYTKKAAISWLKSKS